MTTVRRLVLAGAATAAFALFATAEAASHWLPGERWVDGRVRDAACAAVLASGNRCYEVLRPSSSSVPWLLGCVSLALFAVLSMIVVRNRWLVSSVVGPGTVLSGTVCAMTIVTLVVRSGDDGFGPLGRHWGPTSGDVVWTLLALLAVLALMMLAARASTVRRERGGRPT